MAQPTLFTGVGFTHPPADVLIAFTLASAFPQPAEALAPSTLALAGGAPQPDGIV